MANNQGVLLATAAALPPHEIQMTIGVDITKVDSSNGFESVTVIGRVIDFSVPPMMIYNRAAVQEIAGGFVLKGATNFKGLANLRKKNPAVAAEIGDAAFRDGFIGAFGDVTVRTGDSVRLRPAGAAARVAPPKKGDVVQVSGVAADQYARVVAEDGKFVRFEGGVTFLYSGARTLSSDASVSVDQIPPVDTFPSQVARITGDIAAAAYRDLLPMCPGLRNGTFEEIFAQVTDPEVRSVLDESLGLWRAEVMNALCLEWSRMYLDPANGYICPVAVHVREGGHWRLRAVPAFRESEQATRKWPRLGIEFHGTAAATMSEAPVTVAMDAFDGHVDFFGVEEPEMWGALHTYITRFGLELSAVGKVNLSESSRYPGELRCFPVLIAFGWRQLFDKYGIRMPPAVALKRLALFVPDAAAKDSSKDAADGASGRRARSTADKLTAVARVWAQVYATTGVALLLPGMREKFDAAAAKGDGHYAMLPVVNTDALVKNMSRVWGTKNNHDHLMARMQACIAALAAKSRDDPASMWDDDEMQMDPDALAFLNDRPVPFTESRFKTPCKNPDGTVRVDADNKDQMAAWTLMAYVGQATPLPPDVVAAAAATWRGEPEREYPKTAGKRAHDA